MLTYFTRSSGSRVEAVLLTPENIVLVQQWCQAERLWNSSRHLLGLTLPTQSKAFYNQWIICERGVFSALTQSEFDRRFTHTITRNPLAA